MTIKDAIYREIRFGLCSASGALAGLLDPSLIKLDMRGSAARADYPWLIFGLTSNREDNRIRYAQDEFSFTLIGLRSSPTKGDARLEQIREALVDHFAGKTKTWAKFTEGGIDDPNGGLKLKCVYRGTEEDFDPALEEKLHVLSFTFTRVR